MTRSVIGMLLVAAAARLAAADGVDRALDTPVTVSWRGMPIRTAVARLAELGGCGIVVDRRIDPDTIVTLEATATRLADVLAEIATAADGEVAAYAGHVRIVPAGRAGPLAAADALRTAELRSPGSHAALRRAATASWPDGAVPARLLDALATDAGIGLIGVEDVPHDHLTGLRLPALSVADRIDLVLADLDRRVEWRVQPERGATVRYAIVPMPASDDRAAAPSARPRGRPPAAPPAGPGTTYTLTVAAPLDQLLETLAKRFGLDLDLDLDRAALSRLGVAPAEIVRLEIRDASREQLLDAILGPRRLTWRIESGALRVSADSR